MPQSRYTLLTNAMPEGPLLSSIGAQVRRYIHEPSEQISCAQPIEKQTRLPLDSQIRSTRKSNIFFLFLKRNRRRFPRVCVLSRKRVHEELSRKCKSVRRDAVTDSTGYVPLNIHAGRAETIG